MAVTAERVRGLKIDGGVVVNVAVFDLERGLSPGWILSPDKQIGPGWTANGQGNYTPPPQPPQDEE